MKKLFLLTLALVSGNVFGSGYSPVGGSSGGTVTSVSGTLPISVTSPTTTPVISCAVASGLQAGCLASADFTTFSNKQAAIAGNTCSANQFGVSINTSGTIGCSQPAFSNISGIATPEQTTPASATISASDIDWTARTQFHKTLSANTTFTFSNTADARTIIVYVTNTASNYTVTWPAGVIWPNTTAPVQTVGAHTDQYQFNVDGTDIFGSVTQNFTRP